VPKELADSVVGIYSVADGRETQLGSGVIIGVNGFILAPLHLVKNTGGISVKLRNGEIFDGAKIVNKDERRNVALLRISADGLTALSQKSKEEAEIGFEVSIISNASGEIAITKRGNFAGLQLADNIAGAGNGYRAFTFEKQQNENLLGGLLIDWRGVPIGIVTTNPNVRPQNVAVPISSVVRLMDLVNREVDSSVQAKEVSGVSKAAPELKPNVGKESERTSSTPSAAEVLRTAKTIYVHSFTGFIKDPAFIAELMKNPDFNEWGWSFTKDRETADIVLEVERLPYVIKFAFKVYSIKHGIIIASGNTHTNDFDFGSPDLVHEIIKRIKMQKMMLK
jgi:hypothetical protein